MSWNYRIIEFKDPNTGPWRAIHEVFYDDNQKPKLYAEFPAGVIASEDEKLADVLDMMRKALDRPVLFETDFKGESSD